MTPPSDIDPLDKDYDRYFGYSGWDEIHPKPKPLIIKGVMERWRKIWADMEKPEPLDNVWKVEREE
jgi:hypothetical protein